MQRDEGQAGTGPRQEYSARLGACRATLTAAIARHLTFGNLRIGALILVLAACAAVWFGWSWWWLAGTAAGFLWAGAKLDRAVTARRRVERAIAFYERGLARLDGRWAGAGGETGDRFLNDGHLYARDLDIFGAGSLFELINGARTSIGEDTLAAWLSEPAEPTVVRARQEAVAYLAPCLDLREDFALLGAEARTVVDTEPLAGWAERPPRFGSPGVPVWVWPLSAAGAVALSCLLVLVASWLDLVEVDADTAAALRIYVLAVFAVAGAIVWRFHARTSAVFRGARDAADDLGLLTALVRRVESERYTAPRLTALQAALDVPHQAASRQVARLHVLMMLVDSRDNMLVRLLGPLLLWDVHVAYAIEGWRRASGPRARGWLAAIGEIEALLSLARYRYERPADIFPELIPGPPCFDGEALRHPLVSDAVMVRNDVRLTSNLRAIVVSGSNMSGKSTLLRTVGINAVLAQAGAPVCAQRLRVSPLAVGASILVQDSLQAGVSRFYAEITRLARIMQRASQAPRVLFLFDELLDGTNSHDRRIGAEAIVRGLVARDAIGLLTTHDLALAQIAEDLGARGANMHFEDVLQGGRIDFDYRMRPGVVQHSNALALMRAVGLDI